ncbi:winged helix-turn-helix domain-containing protein [Allopontixanthobacter sp.]|uniref:ArsR/SmtB family transcription factor n=1 Tax=Allopontixanthobacter sp. TaxID=2906452 RepID=UPI002AB83E2F|nr:winged helix-turn-helix domain-containing protein [Allopontixanthobacter sp.]MDZ4308131.1 winged helix-turn-helix domain-containing protein [Allopontixanthobacter sp.]
MKEGPDISRLATLIADPSRANMLTALMSGKALTATELANEAGVTPQTASSHLRKLEDGRLIRIRRQGRHRYFALADEGVARSLEVLMELAETTGHTRTRTGPKDTLLREARVCYNHLAGHLATRLFDQLIRRGCIELQTDGLTLTESGLFFAESFGIDVAGLSAKRSPMCRECLDWSERRSHLSGSLGRAIFDQILHRNWARRAVDSRAVIFSATGRKQFEQLIAG